MNRTLAEIWMIKAILVWSLRWKWHEEHVIDQWRTSDPCYKVAEGLAELCSNVLWKVELVSEETGYLAEAIFRNCLRESTEGVAWFLVTAFSKMWEERSELKKELFSKKGTELKDSENSQLIYIAKNEKTCSEKNCKRIAQQAFDKTVSVGVNHRPNQPPQQKHC